MKLQQVTFRSGVVLAGIPEAPHPFGARGTLTATAAEGLALELSVDAAAGPVVWIRSTEGTVCVPLSNVASFVPIESAKETRAARQQANA